MTTLSANSVWKQRELQVLRQRSGAITDSFRNFVHQAQAKEQHWPTEDAFCETLLQIWFKCLNDVCQIRVPATNGSKCALQCMTDRCIVTLHSDIKTKLRVFGCIRHGAFHRCTAHRDECPCQMTDDHLQKVCIFSGVVLGYHNIGYGGDESRRRTDGGERNADKIVYNRRTQMRATMAFRQAQSSFENRAQSPPKRQKVSDDAVDMVRGFEPMSYADIARQMTHEASRRVVAQREEEAREVRERRAVLGETTNRTTETAAWTFNQRAKKAVRSCIDLVLSHLLYDSERRRTVNMQTRLQTRDSAKAAIDDYHSECKRNGRLPNDITSTEHYNNKMSEMELLSMATRDAQMYEILYQRIVHLWKTCNTSPFYCMHGGAASRAGCTLKQFATAALYTMADGFVVLDDTGFEHVLIPTDAYLALHLPPTSFLGMFGASDEEKARSDMRRQSSSSSIVLEDGSLARNRDYIDEWKLEPAISGSVGHSMQAFQYSTSDVTKGRNFIRNALNSFGTNLTAIHQ